MKTKILGTLLGICLGVVIVGVFFINPNSSRALGDEQKPPLTIQYEKNESGQTYGPMGNEENLPELILVMGVNGKEGYCYLSDMRSSETGWEVKNPEEAMVYMERLKARNGEPIIINVYESDGKTVIDTFEISTGITNNSVSYWN